MKIRKADGLNIVPFIDIMLVLLAIVLSISTFIAQGKIQVEIPKANSSEAPKEEEKRLIVVNASNRIFLDDQELSLELLGQALVHIPPKTLIELKSDKESKFEVFVQILNLLKERQHENFAISTQKD